MRNILLLTIIVIIEFFAINSWFVCTKFADFFHFSLFDLILRLEEGMHNDSGVPLYIVRIFHNKAVGTFVDVYKHFLYYWDILFLANFISIIGVIGLFFAVWYVFQKNSQKRYIVPIFLFLITIQFVEIFLKPNINFTLKIFCFFIPLVILSLFGWSEYMQRNNKTSIWIVLILGLVSLWWLVTFNQAMSTYCFV